MWSGFVAGRADHLKGLLKQEIYLLHCDTVTRAFFTGRSSFSLLTLAIFFALPSFLAFPLGVHGAAGLAIGENRPRRESRYVTV